MCVCVCVCACVCVIVGKNALHVTAVSAEDSSMSWLLGTLPSVFYCWCCGSVWSVVLVALQRVYVLQNGQPGQQDQQR